MSDNKCWGCGSARTTGDINPYCHNCMDAEGAAYNRGLKAGAAAQLEACEKAVLDKREYAFGSNTNPFFMDGIKFALKALRASAIRMGK